MVGAGEPSGRQQDDQEQGGGGEAEQVRRQAKRLRHRVRVLRRVAGGAGRQDRRLPDTQAPGAEDEQVDRVRDERQADDDLVGPGPQQQPDAGSRQHTDAERKDELHHPASRAGCAAASDATAADASDRSGRWVRTDWWARAIRISTVAPTTRTKTPRSKARALATGTVPRSEEHTSELQSLMRISYAVFCLKKKKHASTRQQK